MQDISVETLKARLDNGELFHLIDVRETWEYEESNIGAINIPLSGLMNSLPELEEWKDEEIIIHCRSGSRSLQAAALLEQMGFKDVKNVPGGIEAWKARFPL